MNLLASVRLQRSLFLSPNVSRIRATKVRHVRWFSEEKSIFDTEQEMFQHKRLMSAAYAQGSFRVALDHAQQLKRKALDIMGIRTTVYASSLNNIALMYKMLGEQDKALDAYKEALLVYEDVTGKEHASYAATLSNLGVLYKDMSKGRIISKMDLDGDAKHDKDHEIVPVKGVEKQTFLDNAEEALLEAREIRIKLFGIAHRDTLYSSVHVASLWGLQAKHEDAIHLLTDTLREAEATHGVRDPVCAAIHNDIGFLYKTKGKYSLAKEHYIKALDIRRTALGEVHNDTVISTHNLAELHVALDETEQANLLREGLLAGMERANNKRNTAVATSASCVTNTASTTTASAGGVKVQVHHQVNSFSSKAPTTMHSTSLNEMEKIEMAKRVRESAEEENVKCNEIPEKFKEEYLREKHATIITPTVKPASRRKSPQKK